MENTVETEGYYIADLGVNIEAPKGANSNKLKMYANKLNITPEYKVAMSGQNIPFDEQLYNSTFSDIEVSDLSQTPRLDKKIYNRLAKQKYIEEGKNTAWGSTLLRSGWNQTVDIVEGAVGTAMDLPQDIGAAIAYAANSDELTPERREKWKDELADEALKKIRARKDKTSSIKFDVNEYESKSAQSLGSLMPSTLTMGILGMSTLLRTGNVSKASSLLTLPSLFFGGSSAQEMKQKVLENGGSITDATLRAMMAGSTEYLLEKMGLKAFNKFYKRKHLGWVLGAGGVSEGLQETAQSGKDILVSGKYDKRNTGQKLDDIFDSAWYGFVGGLFFGAGGAKGTYYALSLKEQIYDAAVGVGKDHKTAIQIANAAVPSEGEIKEDLADFLNQELDNLPMATPEQMEKFKADYDEAVSVGGDEAESYIKAKDELKQKLVNAGVEDEKADKEARMFTGIVTNGYQAYKDTERALGREPTKGFDEVKEEFYKLNSVINHSIDDTNEMWADYDSRNQTEFNEEQDMVEGKPSRKLYSFAGERAANLTKEQKTSLDEAKSLEGGLLSAEEIRQTTGWYRGDEGKWRLEISDKDANLKSVDIKQGGLKLSDVLEHEKLFKAYPNIKDIPVIYNPKISVIASVLNTSKGDVIVIGSKFFKESDIEKKGTLMHEVQHIIQGVEGFARGGSTREFRSSKVDFLTKVRRENRINVGLELLGTPNKNSLNIAEARIVADKLIANGDPESDLVKKAVEFKRLDKALAESDKNTAFGKYKRLGGEIEAKNVQARLDFTEEERRAISPEMTRDVPREEAIIKFDDGTEISYGNIEEDYQTQGELLGSYDPYTREVELFKGQNPSTLTHELGHHFLLSHLRLMESMGLKDRNSPVFEWLSKVVGRDINSVADMEELDTDEINPHEALVEAFISYMNNGEAPNLVTENIFKRAKDWLLDRFRVHKTEASTEIRDYFDSIIARDETIPDMSGLTTRTREIAEILKQAKNGEQVSFKGLGKKELKELQKAFHSRVRRKGRSLRDMIIERGGIKEGTELAKALGFDVLKRDKMYTTKDTAFDNEAELIDWLAEEGLIVGVQEGEDYSATERRWEDVQRLIDNAENTYTVRESLINQERETALANQAHVQEIVDELLKDNDLGLKDINDLDDLLSKIVSRKDDVDITKVNSNAIKYLNERVKGLNKEIKALERNKNKEFKNKREEQYQAQNDLKDFIRGLPINNQHKVALMGNIQRVKDYDSLAQIVNDLKPRIRGYIEQEAKHLMRNNINNILINSKPRERKKQNFNYDYNKLFEELREYNKLTQEQAYEKRMEVLDMLGEGIEFDEFEKLKNMFLSYKAMGADTSIDLLKKLSDELSAIYNDAINDKMESDIAKAEQREEKIKGIVNYIENTKAVNKLNQRLLKMTNLNSNLSELFGKKWADEHKMDSYLIKQDMETNKALDEVIRVGKDIYKLKDREELIKLMNDMRIPKEEYTLNNYRDDFSQPISKMQLIDIYLTIKNKGSAEAYNRLYEDFDEEGNQTTTQIEDLLSNLTEEDKKFGDMLQKRVNDLYDAENKVYVKLYGIDMPKHENYWMRSSERSERELMDIKQFMNLDMLPSFMKERAKAPSVYPDDAFKKFARRMHDSKYMTEVFEHYKDLYDTIHSNRVKKAIVKKYDDKRYQALNQSLKRISLGGVNEGYSELNNILGKAVTNWVVSKISLSETVFVKQLASFTNYAENVPVTDFVKYQAEFWTNPKKAIDFMKEFAGEYLDHRFKSGIQNEVLKRIMTSAPEDYSKATGIYQKYLNLVTLPVRFGDIGAIYIGGYARAKYLVDQGVPLEKARKMFVEETESAQQSGNKAELSEFQENPLWRVFTAFKNTNLQYMRKMQDSYIQYTRGEIDAKQFGKIWGNYMVVQSILYQVLTNIGTWWRDDDDEELQPMKDVWMRILTSPVAGFPIIGDITEGIFAENYWGLNISGKQDMEAFIGGARDVLNGKFDPKKIAKGSVALTSFFRPMPDRVIKGVINLIEE